MATQIPPMDPSQNFAEQNDAYAEGRRHQFDELMTEMLGDEAPEPTASDAATPTDDATSAEETDAVSATPDAKDADAKEPATPDPKADAADDPAEPTSDDLLAKATAFEYTVDGQSKTIDGIKEIPGHGAIVEANALSLLKDRLQKADRLDEANRTLYQKVQSYDQIEHSGKKGLDAIEALVVDHAKLSKALNVLVPYLESEEGRVALVSDPAGTLQYLARELGLTAREVEFTTRQSFGQRIRQAETQQAETQTRAEQQQVAIGNTIRSFAAKYAALTDDDIQAATKHLQAFAGSIIRPATDAEAKQFASRGVVAGQPVIDERLIDQYLADRAALRTEAATAKEQASAAAKAASTAASENAKRLAAAATGRGAKKAAPPKPDAREQKPAKRERDFSDMKRQMLRGEWPDEVTGASDDE